MGKTKTKTSEKPRQSEKPVGSKTKTRVSSRDADCDVFTEKYFGINLYDWQKKVLFDLSKPGARVALKAANGSGKTAMIAAPAALWYALIYRAALSSQRVAFIARSKSSFGLRSGHWRVKWRGWGCRSTRPTSRWTTDRGSWGLRLINLDDLKASTAMFS